MNPYHNTFLRNRGATFFLLMRDGRQCIVCQRSPYPRKKHAGGGETLHRE